jgi:hypothetical protein
VMIKRCNLVNLGRRQSHFMGKRNQVSGRQMSMTVLNFVQVLNQQVLRPWFIAQQSLHFKQGVEVNYPALGLASAALLAIIDRYGIRFRLWHKNSLESGYL